MGSAKSLSSLPHADESRNFGIGLKRNRHLPGPGKRVKAKTLGQNSPITRTAEN
jgi:hypothetical protein